MRSALQPYCERPCRPSGPALSHRPGSGGGVRRSCSTAALAVCSPALGRGPQLGALLPAAPLLPSCSEDTKLCSQQWVLVSVRRCSGLCPPAVARCLHARERAKRSHRKLNARPRLTGPNCLRAHNVFSSL